MINLHQLHMDEVRDGDGDGAVGEAGVAEDAPCVALVLVMTMAMNSPGRRRQIRQDQPFGRWSRLFCFRRRGKLREKSGCVLGRRWSMPQKGRWGGGVLVGPTWLSHLAQATCPPGVPLWPMPPFWLKSSVIFSFYFCEVQKYAFPRAFFNVQFPAGSQCNSTIR